MSLHVHLLPSLMPSPLPAGSVGVIIDILRASTTIIHALANGAREVIPCLTVEQAELWARQLAERPLLGGERHAQLIPGFDLDNSPLKYTSQVVAGRQIVFTTTNGTKALQQCQAADEALIGAFVNRRALVQRLVHEPRPIHLICAGTDGFLTAEDILFAGAVTHEVLGDTTTSDLQSQMALDFYRLHARTDDEFRRTMYASRGGQNLLALGCAADIDRAMTFDLFDVVPIWNPGSGVITIGERGPA